MTSNDSTTTRRNFRRVLAGAIAAISLATGLAGPSNALAATPVSLTLEAQAGGFFGFVQSADEACEGFNKVTLFKVKGNGKLKKIGSDIAQPNGPDSMFSIPSTKAGPHIAKTKGNELCGAATSPTVQAQL